MENPLPAVPNTNLSVSKVKEENSNVHRHEALPQIPPNRNTHKVQPPSLLQLQVLGLPYWQNEYRYRQNTWGSVASLPNYRSRRIIAFSAPARGSIRFVCITWAVDEFSIDGHNLGTRGREFLPGTYTDFGFSPCANVKTFCSSSFTSMEFTLFSSWEQENRLLCRPLFFPPSFFWQKI